MTGIQSSPPENPPNIEPLKPALSQNKSWFTGIFSSIGNFSCAFSFGKKATYEPAPDAVTFSASIAGMDGKPTVKAKWGYFTSLYHWARGNTFTTVTDRTPINVEDPQNSIVTTISMSGRYRVSDPINLALVSASLKKIKPSSTDAQTDQKRGCFATIKNRNQKPPFADHSKLEKFNESLKGISHQGIIEPITGLFTKGNPPTGACFIGGARNIHGEYFVNNEETEVTLTLIIEAHRNPNTGIYFADTPLHNISGAPGIEDLRRKPLSPLKNASDSVPGIATTTMKIKATLNDDGSLNIGSLECESIEGNWQIGSYSNKTVNLTDATSGKNVSVPKQGMNDVVKNELLKAAAEKIRQPITTASSTFAADINRGYIHQGEDSSVTGEAFLKEFSGRIHPSDRVKATKLKEDLMAHCHQGLFSGATSLYRSTDPKIIKLLPKNSLLVGGGKEKKDVKTTLRYKHLPSDPKEYPYGRIEIEAEQTIANHGNALCFNPVEGNPMMLTDSKQGNVSGSIFMKITLKIHDQDGGVTTIENDNKSALDAIVQAIETRWQIC